MPHFASMLEHRASARLSQHAVRAADERRERDRHDQRHAREPGAFADHHVQLLQTFADQAVIAIENVRLFDEVQAKTRDLSEALTYQTGSGNILSVIASSPTDVEPVLKAIVESACELCDAYDAVVLLKDGDDLRFSAHHGPIAISIDKWPINRDWAAGRSVIDRGRCMCTTCSLPKAMNFRKDGRWRGAWGIAPF